jgi:hypothetical protein
LFDSDAWSPILREEHKYQMPENEILMKVCGSKRDKVENRGYYQVTKYC